jgi:hypothetical protein
MPPFRTSPKVAPAKPALEHGRVKRRSRKRFFSSYLNRPGSFALAE